MAAIDESRRTVSTEQTTLYTTHAGPHANWVGTGKETSDESYIDSLDGSDDCSVRAAQHLALLQIRATCQEKNGGRGASRGAGAAKA